MLFHNNGMVYLLFMAFMISCLASGNKYAVYEDETYIQKELPQTYEKANKSCSIFNGAIASLHHQAMLRQAQKLLKNNTRYWISDDHVADYQDEEEEDAADPLTCKSVLAVKGQDGNYTGTITTTACDSKRLIVCQARSIRKKVIDKRTKNAYVFTNVKTNTDLNNTCRKILPGSVILRIKNQAEQNFIENQLNALHGNASNITYFIQFSKSGNGFTNWNIAEGVPLGHACAMINSNTGKWSREECEKEFHPIICKREPKLTTTVATMTKVKTTNVSVTEKTTKTQATTSIKVTEKGSAQKDGDGKAAITSFNIVLVIGLILLSVILV